SSAASAGPAAGPAATAATGAAAETPHSSSSFFTSSAASSTVSLPSSSAIAAISAIVFLHCGVVAVGSLPPFQPAAAGPTRNHCVFGRRPGEAAPSVQIVSKINPRG